MRLSPFDPLLNRMQGAIAIAHLFAGRYVEASSWAERALRDQATYVPALRVLAAGNALAGRPKEAQKAMECLRQVEPFLRVSNIVERLALPRPEDLAILSQGLRLAGLPE
jgi:hypothetical protein